VPRHPLKVALQIFVGGLCRLNHHELSFAISDFNERIGLFASVENCVQIARQSIIITEIVLLKQHACAPNA
jgi:hypothetical protein